MNEERRRSGVHMQFQIISIDLLVGQFHATSHHIMPHHSYDDIMSSLVKPRFELLQSCKQDMLSMQFKPSFWCSLLAWQGCCQIASRQASA